MPETLRAYYVTHPLVGVTATVYAPSSEKARTTYLDFLERSGRIRRNVRKLLRSNLVAQHLDAGTSVPTDVTLNYTYSSQGMSVPRVSMDEFTDSIWDDGVMSREDFGVEPLEAVGALPGEEVHSPVEKAMLGKYA